MFVVLREINDSEDMRLPQFYGLNYPFTVCVQTNERFDRLLPELHGLSRVLCTLETCTPRLDNSPQAYSLEQLRNR